MKPLNGRLAQPVRAPALQAGGRRFDPRTAHHIINSLRVVVGPFKSAYINAYSIFAESTSSAVSPFLIPGQYDSTDLTAFCLAKSRIWL